jgi:hypothetical protein
LRCYERFAERLKQEIGTAPSPAITATIAGHLGVDSTARLPGFARPTGPSDGREADRRRPDNGLVPPAKRSTGGREARR